MVATLADDPQGQSLVQQASGARGPLSRRQVSPASTEGARKTVGSESTGHETAP